LRLTILAGIAEVAVIGSVAVQTSMTTGGVFLDIDKSGVGDVLGLLPSPPSGKVLAGCDNNASATSSACSLCPSQGSDRALPGPG
jgi:hypothetical protein